MSRIIKLIWDFKGEDAKHVAEHHKIHIEEFVIRERMTLLEVGTENLTEHHSLAFMHVLERDVFAVRDALIPHRAEIVE